MVTDGNVFSRYLGPQGPEKALESLMKPLEAVQGPYGPYKALKILISPPP